MFHLYFEFNPDIQIFFINRTIIATKKTTKEIIHTATLKLVKKVASSAIARTSQAVSALDLDSPFTIDTY